MNTKKLIEYKGVILFYIVIALLSFLFSMRVEYLNQLDNTINNNVVAVAK